MVAPSFPEDLLEAYQEAIQGTTKAWFEVEESFTGYSGFVRLGSRRGFHLLLVEETDTGYSPLV